MQIFTKIIFVVSICTICHGALFSQQYDSTQSYSVFISKTDHFVHAKFVAFMESSGYSDQDAIVLNEGYEKVFLMREFLTTGKKKIIFGEDYLDYGKSFYTNFLKGLNVDAVNRFNIIPSSSLNSPLFEKFNVLKGMIDWQGDTTVRYIIDSLYVSGFNYQEDYAYPLASFFITELEKYNNTYLVFGKNTLEAQEVISDIKMLMQQSDDSEEGLNADYKLFLSRILDLNDVYMLNPPDHILRNTVPKNTKVFIDVNSFKKKVLKRKLAELLDYGVSEEQIVVVVTDK